LHSGTDVSIEIGAVLQLFFAVAQIVALQQLGRGTMLAMDWRRVRKTLQELRIEKKMGVPELADDAGLAKSTVYRIEDVDDEPDKELDLLTIEKLTAAMDVPLSTFFARVEGVTLTASETAGLGDLDADARQLGIELAVALDKHLRARRTGEQPRGALQEAHTKSGSDRRR
jgi:transcriptional regulator with XRE-family HTH domain